MPDPTVPAISLYSTGDDVRRLVAQYLKEERNASLRAFTIRPTLRWTDIGSMGDDGPGCYAIYGENGGLLYVGMSVTNVTTRIKNHAKPVVQNCLFWKQHPPASFDLILVPQRWDAPSLEEYLTCKTTRYKALA